MLRGISGSPLPRRCDSTCESPQSGRGSRLSSSEPTRVNRVDGRYLRAKRSLPRVAGPICAGRVQCKLGGRADFTELVRYGARVDRTLASSAADSTGDESSGNLDARTVPS